jgi:conjugative transfer signal peptidase TraF
MRRSAVGLLGILAAVLGTLVGAEAAGLRLNTSVSMPRGVWRVVPAGAAPRRGDVVAVCPPASMMRAALARGYVAAGGCPDGTEPLVKPVAAIAGDVVRVTPDGITVNGVASPQTALLAQDSAGRPLQSVPTGIYRVAPDQVWLLSDHDSRSFDSRYFGPVSVKQLIGAAYPVWTE